MGKYKIKNTEFTFDVEDLFTNYGEITEFPIRPNRIEGLGEILFQISERREHLQEGTALVIYETPLYQYIIENRLSNYRDDVYLVIYGIYGNGLRIPISNNVVGAPHVENIIIDHIFGDIEWLDLRNKD